MLGQDLGRPVVVTDHALPITELVSASDLGFVVAVLPLLEISARVPDMWVCLTEPARPDAAVATTIRALVTGPRSTIVRGTERVWHARVDEQPCSAEETSAKSE